MDASEATGLITTMVAAGDAWADLGAGTGTFTAALARLVGREGRVYAVERDAHAVRALGVLAQRQSRDDAPITIVDADFRQRLDLPALDGVLLANSLHFVADDEQSPLLSRLAALLRAKGATVIIEYDNRPRSRWVPFPVSLARLGDLARAAGFAAPVIVGRRASEYGGTMYVARLDRRAAIGA